VTRLITGNGSTSIFEYTLTSAYDISSVASTSNHEVNTRVYFNTNHGGGTTHAQDVTNLRFNADGTKLAMFGQKHKGDDDNNNLPAVTVISLSTAYDIDSTLAVDSQFDPYFESSASLTGDISPDGRYLVFYSVDPATVDLRRYTTGTTDQVPYQIFYNDAGGFDVSKAVGGGYYRLHDLQNTSATELKILRISDDGKFLYTHEQQSSNNNNPIIRQYVLSGGHQVTMPSAVTSLPSDFGNGDDPNTVTYLKLMTVNGGTKVLITDHKEILA